MSAGGPKFVVLEDYHLEDVVTKTSFLGLFNETKEKLVPNKSFSIKSTDISHLESAKDDYGTKYVDVVLEDRCNLEFSKLCVLGDIKTVTQNIQNQIKGVK